MRGYRRDLARLSSLYGRVSDQPFTREDHPRSGSASLRGTRSTPRILPSSPRFRTIATCSCGRTIGRPWRSSPNSQSTMPRSFPSTRGHLERLSEVVEGLLLTTPPEFPPRGIGDFIDYLKLAGRLRKLSAREMTGLVKIFTQSAAEFLDEWFESDQVKVTLATDGVIGANGGPRSPGTAYILLHHVMGSVAANVDYGDSCEEAWVRFPMPSPIRPRSRGAEIRTNADVERSKFETDALTAWSCAAVKRSRLRIVASNLTPHVTFLESDRSQPAPFRTSGRHTKIPQRRNVLQDQSRLERTPEFSSPSRRSRPAASRHDAHLPVDRICRTCVGRRQVRAAV